MPPKKVSTKASAPRKPTSAGRHDHDPTRATRWLSHTLPASHRTDHCILCGGRDHYCDIATDEEDTVCHRCSRPVVSCVPPLLMAHGLLCATVAHGSWLLVLFVVVVVFLVFLCCRCCCCFCCFCFFCFVCCCCFCFLLLLLLLLLFFVVVVAIGAVVV